MAKMGENTISGVQKAAILLIALGPEKSSMIFKHLKEDEIEELTLEIANTRSITPQIKDDVINEFYEICLAQQYIAEGGIGYAKELLEKALGAEKAMDVIGKLTASLQVKPFEFVRKADASQILNFIQDEHPQTIALILSYLAPSQSSMILSALPPDRQADVAKRIATMDRTSPDVIKEVERVLETQLSSLVNQDYTTIGGVDAVVEILNTVDRGTEKHIMETLEIEDPELADEIRRKMFVFEDILLLDDRAIQRVLRDVENSDLAIALKGSTEQVQNAIFNNLSKRLAAMIQEDMEFMGPVRMKDVEEAQLEMQNTYGVYPPVSVGAVMKYTYENEKKTFLERYHIIDKLEEKTGKKDIAVSDISAETAFNMIRESFKINKDVSNRKARNIMVVREQSRKG